MIQWMLTSLGLKGIAIAAAVLIGSGFLAYEIHHLKKLGAQAERARIERANQEAERKANDGSSDVDRCFNAGNHWDRNRGLCVDGPGP